MTRFAIVRWWSVVAMLATAPSALLLVGAHAAGLT